jgi:hypothetical protein
MTQTGHPGTIQGTEVSLTHFAGYPVRQEIVAQAAAAELGWKVELGAAIDPTRGDWLVTMPWADYETLMGQGVLHRTAGPYTGHAEWELDDEDVSG